MTGVMQVPRYCLADYSVVVQGLEGRALCHQAKGGLRRGEGGCPSWRLKPAASKFYNTTCGTWYTSYDHC